MRWTKVAGYSAVAPLFLKSFTAGLGCTTNCKLVSISCSFVVIVVIFVLRYLY